MQKVNSHELPEDSWTSPKGKYAGTNQTISLALGRDPDATDLAQRHPFDVTLLRVPPGKTPYPFHSHSAQWEFYHVISGTGEARDSVGLTAIQPGDAFIFKPTEPHQIFNTGETDLVLYVIADNPFGEVVHYPDSQKWGMRSPVRQVFRPQPQDYYEGEE